MRFMVAPLLGLLLLAILTGAFLAQSYRQSALLARVANEDLTQLTALVAMSVGLSRAHMSLFDLLDRRDHVSEEVLYDRATQRLDAIRSEVAKLRDALEATIANDRAMGRASDAEIDLLGKSDQYLKAATRAIDVATLDTRLATEQLAHANDNYVALSLSFNALLDSERAEIGAEMLASARHSEVDNMAFGAIGLLLALLLLVFSLGISRIFTRSLERQLDSLVQLGREAGVQASRDGGGDQIDRIAAAIGMFRAAVLRLRAHDRELTSLNEALEKHRAELELRVAQRTQALSSANVELSREVSERTFAQQALVRATRSYAALSETNKAILHVTERERLFLAVCRIAVEEGGIGAACVSLIGGEPRTITPFIRAGTERLRDLGLSEPASPAVVRAVLNDRPYIANDLAAEPDLGRAGLEHGAGRSAAWFPLFEGGRAIAALSLHCAEVGFFDAQVIALFAEMVDNISFGLDNLERERERAQTEQALRLRDRAIEASVNAITIVSATRSGFPLEYVNPAYEAITGYTAAEVLGRDGALLQGIDRDQPGVEGLRAALREKREGHALLRNRRKDGRLFWNDLRLAPVRDEGGAVTHFVGVINDVTEAKDYQEQLEHQANHDALTGLPNRNLMRDRLAQAIAYGKRNGYSVAVAVVDLDHFKMVNDSLGHSAGDELLTSAARRIQSCLRSSDTLARMGGDEFVLILPDDGVRAGTHAEPLRAGRDDDTHVADALRRIQDGLSAPIVAGSRNFHVTCSIGVSRFPQDATSIEGLLQQADAAMYEAKARGRARFHFYSSDLNQRITRKVELEAGMRGALAKAEFELHYQPKLDLASGRVVGAEALLRWNSGMFGRVSPAEFIPLAEETGLIEPIGEWVLETACAQIAQWRDSGLPLVKVSVNLSPRQLHAAELVERVCRMLAANHLPPQTLELEITETALAADWQRMRDLLQRLSAHGIQLSIDDFGTGYSSLAYLKRFRANTLKIDRAFVRDIVVDPGDASLTSAIIAMARDLGMRTVAEGVETTAQMERLRSLGCDEIQGFLLSAALPAGEFADFLRARRRLDAEAGERARTSERLPAAGTRDQAFP